VRRQAQRDAAFGSHGVARMSRKQKRRRRSALPAHSKKGRVLNPADSSGTHRLPAVE